MKNLYKIALLLIAGCAIQSTYPYAISHGSKSAAEAVDILVFGSLDEQDAKEAFPRYLKAMGAPGVIIQYAQYLVGPAATLGGILAVPTEGISVAVAAGYAGGIAAATAFLIYKNPTL